MLAKSPNENTAITSFITVLRVVVIIAIWVNTLNRFLLFSVYAVINSKCIQDVAFTQSYIQDIIRRKRGKLVFLMLVFRFFFLPPSSYFSIYNFFSDSSFIDHSSKPNPKQGEGKKEKEEEGEEAG